MEVLGSVLGRHLEEVAARIALGVLAVDSARGVEGLVDVSDVVDEESESVRSGLLFILNVGLEGLVYEAGLVVAALREPVDYAGYYHRDVVLVKFELRVVIKRPAFIKEGNVDEMPRRLERPALRLNLVSEGGALNEWVVALELSHAWVCVGVDLEQIIGGLEGVGALLEQLIVGDSGD